mmetsp:Transcript_11443/g.24687  ORF Transcript_11443/g.24687 Transcript_11443/m.24687 type:complete len:1052 (+) Transcript_11443:37-3192(+)
MECEVPWAVDSEQVLRSYGHGEAGEEKEKYGGLGKEQVEMQRSKFGVNLLEVEEGTPLWKLILEQFQDQLVIILLFAAGVSFVLALSSPSDDPIADFFEPLVILLILIANAVVGVLQERNAEAALEALKSHQPEYATALRNRGERVRIPAAELVPGDIIEVATGDKVPADARVVAINSSVLYVDQSMATGESDAVSKRTEKCNETAVLQDKVCMVFGGTVVVRGKATCVVTATGSASEIGKIHDSINAEEDAVSPLKRKLDAFGAFLSKVILVICIAVWLVNVRNFGSHGSWMAGALYYFKIAIALAVAAIPEGLPAVVTTCLALGTKRMSRRNAIVRHLPAVEALGCTTVICSDKTGTLTTNNMSVLRVALLAPHDELAEFDVAGQALDPRGSVAPFPATGSERVEFPAARLGSELGLLFGEVAEVGTLCNESSIVFESDSNSFGKIGEGTEAALAVLAERLGVADAKLSAEIEQLPEAERAMGVRAACLQKWAKEATLDFSRDRKSMSVLVRPQHQHSGGGLRLLAKGAPENVISRCAFAREYDNGVPKRRALTDAAKQHVLAKVEEWSSQHALRCLAIAVRDVRDELGESGEQEFAANVVAVQDVAQFAAFEENMTLLGVVGMLDPPREEVAEALRLCECAGVRVIVVTGDNPLTAAAVCRMIGLVSGADGPDAEGSMITGAQWDAMDDAEKRRAARTARVFARVEPVHKLQLVEVLQAQHGEVVAMTGDGVNDAPALKKADIGVAMGSGTAVAREVSSMVLADDNFATIVAAVEEGRAIYANMKQFIRYLISSNIGEVWCIFLTALLGLPEALVPVQLLWVNLVTDGLPATALSFNPEDDDIMLQRPRGMDDAVVDAWLFLRYMVVGTYVGVATVGGFVWWFVAYSAGPQMSWAELTSFGSCVDDTLGSSARAWSCSVFGLNGASTVALTILVTIEMLNALNSVSENHSMVQFSPFRNPLLIGASALSMVLHAVILYVPFFNRIFQTAPLTVEEWGAVLAFSVPVIIIDEIMKLIARMRDSSPTPAASNTSIPPDGVSGAASRNKED